MFTLILVIFGIWIYLRYLGPIIVFFQKVDPLAKKPTKSYGRAACWDVYSVESVTIPTEQWRQVRLGIKIAPAFHFYIPFLSLTITPFGNVAYKIHTRSGLAFRKGLRNHLGIIDNDYREELTVIIYNHGKYPFTVKKGDKIAQIEFFRVPTVIFFHKKKLSNSARSTKGFGSSGR
jgi:dUTP pyrophosphatase|uniref:dUTP diphosphatase n=1 Tax=Dictyoglomus turgidum TaxID=513050 RepID=A0A7C3SMM9_9BACT